VKQYLVKAKLWESIILASPDPARRAYPIPILSRNRWPIYGLWSGVRWRASTKLVHVKFKIFARFGCICCCEPAASAQRHCPGLMPTARREPSSCCRQAERCAWRSHPSAPSVATAWREASLQLPPQHVERATALASEQAAPLLALITGGGASGLRLALTAAALAPAEAALLPAQSACVAAIVQRYALLEMGQALLVVGRADAAVRVLAAACGAAPPTPPRAPPSDPPSLPPMGSADDDARLASLSWAGRFAREAAHHHALALVAASRPAAAAAATAAAVARGVWLHALQRYIHIYLSIYLLVSSAERDENSCSHTDELEGLLDTSRLANGWP